MPKPQIAGLEERLKFAAEAKAKRLETFKPKVAAPDPQFAERQALRAAELNRVRAEHEQAKAERRQVTADAAAAAEQVVADEALAAQEAIKGKRKARKVLSAAEAKDKRDARYAARRAR
jgi:hypothetical protein